jgi:hypothetical protein
MYKHLLNITGRNQAYTVTFGDRAENGRGMQIIGKEAKRGISAQRLRLFEQKLVAAGTKCKLVDLSELLPGCESIPEAAMLVIYGGVNAGLGEGAEEMILEELKSMPKDKETLYRDQGRAWVGPKKNRYNNTMADFSQEADLINGKGTVINFKEYAQTSRLRCMLSGFVGAPLVAETNDYFESERCGIGFHGDDERKIVIGVRFGAGINGMPLLFKWFKGNSEVGKMGRIDLNAGDMYIMSEKAVGFDSWKEKFRPTLTLRHAAGSANLFCMHGAQDSRTLATSALNGPPA